LTVSVVESYCEIVTPRRPTLVQVLHLALERIQEREQLTPDDPALLQLKPSILTSIAELEIEKDEHLQDPAA